LCVDGGDDEDGGDDVYDVLDFETGKIHSVFPPVDIVENNRDNFLIQDIVISSIDGPLGGDVTYVVLCKDTNRRYLGIAEKRIVVNDVPAVDQNLTHPTQGEPTSYPAPMLFYLPVYRVESRRLCPVSDEIGSISGLNLRHIGKTTEWVTLYSHADWVRYCKSIIIQYPRYEPLMNRVFKTFPVE
jgi:hypothetical protein